MRVKTLCIFAAVSWLIPIGGCDMTSGQRVALLEDAVAEMQARSGQAETALVAIEAVLASSRTALLDPNLPPAMRDEVIAVVAEAQIKLDKGRAVKASVDATLAQLRGQLAAAGEIAGPGDEVAMIGRGVSTVGAHLPPPIGVYATLAGSLITAIGGVLVGVKKNGALKRKTAEATALDTALAEVVAGGQVFKVALGDNAELMAAFKKSHDGQSMPTRERVAVARVRGAL